MLCCNLLRNPTFSCQIGVLIYCLWFIPSLFGCGCVLKTCEVHYIYGNDYLRSRLCILPLITDVILRCTNTNPGVSKRISLQTAILKVFLYLSIEFPNWVIFLQRFTLYGLYCSFMDSLVLCDSIMLWAYKLSNSCPCQ